LALLLASVASAALYALVYDLISFSRFNELPAGSKSLFILMPLLNFGAFGIYSIWAIQVFLARPPVGTTTLGIPTSFGRLSGNCLIAVFLVWGALYILFGLESRANYSWTDGGIPAILLSIGWGTRGHYFVYDTLRFCLFSFIALWPVTFLRPHRPVLYLLCIMATIILMFGYWRTPAQWATLPNRAILTSFLSFVHVLSFPAMYLIHIAINKRNESYGTA